MAEFADVRLALQTVIENIVYPNGTSAACAIPGLTGKCAVFLSDPTPLDIDKRVAGADGFGGSDVLISVREMGDARSTKRLPVEAVVTFTPAATFSWSIDPTGTILTLNGSNPSPFYPQNLAVIINRKAHFVYQTGTADTANSAAADLGVLISAQFACTVTGNQISVPNVYSLIGRVGVISTTITEVGRQLSRFRVSIWAPTEALRSATSALLRSVLDNQQSLPLADGSRNWMGWGVEMPAYEILKVNVARTNLVYQIEFASTLPGTAPQVVAAEMTVQGGAAPIPDFTGTSPPIETIEG